MKGTLLKGTLTFRSDGITCQGINLLKVSVPFNSVPFMKSGFSRILRGSPRLEVK